MTRFIDILAALVGLTIFLLMLPVVALFIKLDTPGPVLIRCRRVGKDGRIFDMFKFRTMQHRPQDLGPSVSPQGDPRVTAVGRVLRRLKLNEFPQFINLLKGDMTLVGPRPEAPDLAAHYPPEARKIFSVKPGLIGPNQILGRNEEEFYPPEADPQEFYLQEILPKKLPVDLAYIEDRSLLKNLKYLLQGLWVTVAGAINGRHLWQNRTQIYFFIGDVVLILLSFTIAHFLRFGLQKGTGVWIYGLGSILPWAVLVRLPIFLSMGFYHVLVRHISLYDIKRVIQGVALSSGALVLTAYFLGLTFGYGRTVFIIDWFCLTTLLVGFRAGAKVLHRRYRLRPAADEVRQPVLIWGAGDCGELCLRYLRKERQPGYEVVGFIDDHPLKRGKRLQGVKILGNRHQLALIKELYQVQAIFIAIRSANPGEQQQRLKLCLEAGLQPYLFLDRCLLPNPAELPGLTYLPLVANGYGSAMASSRP